MARRPMDVAPRRVELPDLGWGRGWEPALLVALTATLFAFGVVSLYSAAAFLAHEEGLPDHYYALRHAQGGLVGLVALAVCAKLDYRIWNRLAWPLVALSALLLVFIVLPITPLEISPRINGARRWLNIGPLQIQPSEIAKLAIISWTAMMAVRKQEEFKSLSKGLLPFLIVWGVLLIPIVKEPDLSTTMLIGMVGALTLFAAGARVGHFLFLGILVAPALWYQLFGVGYRAARLEAWLNPSAHTEGAGYHLYQSLVAFGSGGITGRGFGEGQQKFGFIPEPHNDFIFALIGEEWGFIGVTLTVVMYAALIMIGYRIARRAPDLFGQLLAVGCTNLIALQAFLHMGVVLGLLPATGLPLPFVSYGRSSLVIGFVLIGILISVARKTDVDWAPDTLERTRRPDLAREGVHAGGAFAREAV